MDLVYLKHSKNTPASTGGEMNCCNKLTNEHMFAIMCINVPWGARELTPVETV